MIVAARTIGTSAISSVGRVNATIQAASVDIPTQKSFRLKKGRFIVGVVWLGLLEESMAACWLIGMLAIGYFWLPKNSQKANCQLLSSLRVQLLFS